MKTIVGKSGLVAMVVSALPLGSLAASSPSLQSGSRDVTRLTLLTGPNLTSPAHNAPMPATVTPLISAPTPEVGSFHFVPSPPPSNAAVKSGPGVLTLRPAGDSAKTPEPAPKRKLPKPESLRFDSTLHSPAPPPKVEFTPAPKRD